MRVAKCDCALSTSLSVIVMATHPASRDLQLFRRSSMEHVFRNILTRSLLVAFVLSFLLGTMWAQGGVGELTGLVTDPSGAVVSNAPVTLTNASTGDKRSTV